MSEAAHEDTPEPVRQEINPITSVADPRKDLIIRLELLWTEYADLEDLIKLGVIAMKNSAKQVMDLAEAVRAGTTAMEPLTADELRRLGLHREEQYREAQALYDKVKRPKRP